MGEVLQGIELIQGDDGEVHPGWLQFESYRHL
jgi:hypothetical protein